MRPGLRPGPAAAAIRLEVELLDANIAFFYAVDGGGEEACQSIVPIFGVRIVVKVVDRAS